MAKRLSKSRRHALLNRKLVIARAKGNDDSVKLQQGAETMVRSRDGNVMKVSLGCALNRPAAGLKGLVMPRGLDLESRGIKKSRGAKQRWSTK